MVDDTFPYPYDESGRKLSELDLQVLSWCTEQQLSMRCSVVYLELNQIETWEYKQKVSKVNKLSRALRSGEGLPPIFIHSGAEEEGLLRLIDGHHRLLAHEQEGLFTIAAVEIPESTHEALLSGECPFFNGDSIDICVLFSKANPWLWK
jgi:hypothetical protein